MNSTSDVMVSVLCLAYNHEKYIRKTLEGFVNQHTSFSYEVYVHDDASTDKTTDIIREFADEYPDIIKPIYQRQNQFSMNVDVVGKFILPLMHGKYIAVCEGDDYWCDYNKLQLQYEKMESSSDALFCIHPVQVINEKGKQLKEVYPHRSISAEYISRDEFIDLVCRDFVQLSSFFCRLDKFKEYTYNKPVFEKNSDVGDIPLYLYMGCKSGRVAYINKIMSCYRANSCSSWNRSLMKDIQKVKLHKICMIKMIESFNAFSIYKYNEACKIFRQREEFNFYIKKLDVATIFRDSTYRKMFAQLSIKTRISIVRKAVWGKLRGYRKWG